jgi:glycosyltransferase 2 family protein
MTSSADTQRSTPRLARLLFQWSIPVVLLAAFVWTGQFGESMSTLRELQLVWTVPLVLVGIALPVSHAWRWCFLLKRTGSNLPLPAATRITALSSLLNYAAPGFLGAPAKAIFARNERKIEISRSLPTLIAEQLLDAALLLLAGTLAIIIAGPIVIELVTNSLRFELQIWTIVAVAGACLLLVVLWLLIRRVLPNFLSATANATRTLLSTRDSIRPIGALTATRWLLDMLAIAIASAAVGLRLGLVDILLLANLALLAGMIAPVPGGLGVREAVMVAIAGVIGVTAPAIVAVSIVHRAGLAFGLLVVLIAGRLLDRGD